MQEDAKRCFSAKLFGEVASLTFSKIFVRAFVDEPSLKNPAFSSLLGSRFESTAKHFATAKKSSTRHSAVKEP